MAEYINVTTLNLLAKQITKKSSESPTEIKFALP